MTRWITTREEALAVLRDPARYTVDHPDFATARIVGPSLLSTDGEEHARRRAPFEGRFTLPDAWLRGEAEALVAQFGDNAELRAEYAGPFAARVMQHVLGLDHVPIAELLRGYAAISAATVGDIPEAEGRAAFAQLPLDSDTAVALFGGIDTMEGMILNLVLHVLTGQATTVDGSLALDPAVAEVHRYDGDELVVVRLKDAALPFAAGPHVCPAARLARQEARIALEALPPMTLVGPAPVVEGAVFRKPVALRVKFSGITE